MAGKLIGQIARDLGLNPRTLRYYERRRLLPAPKRSSAGYRIYDEDTPKRLLFIGNAKSLGLTLREIRQVIVAGANGRPPCDSVREMFKSHVHRIDEQIAHLRALKSDLQSMLGLDCHAPKGKVGAARQGDVCPLIESMSTANGRPNFGGGRR